MKFFRHSSDARRGAGHRAGLGLAAVLALGTTAGAVPAYAAEESPTPAVTSEAAAGQPVVKQGAADQAGADRAGSDQAAADRAGSDRAATETAATDEGLVEALARDLGMTLEEFNAAGAQAKRAADSLTDLRNLPGFVAVRLQDGHIQVEGSGPELEEAVARLNKAGGTGGDGFVLVSSGSNQPPNQPANPSGNPAPTNAAAAELAEGGELQASSVDQLYRAYLRDVGAAGLQAVAEGDGQFIIRTGGVNSPETAGEPDSQGGSRAGAETAAPGVSPSDFVARYGNVVLEQGEPLASEEDFLGGQGYRIDGGGVVCSAGFSAFSPAGEPLVLTAGHCAGDGAARLTEITLPAGDPAGGAVAASAVTGQLGTFGFSQFGGPGNARITGDLDNPGEPGKDIAVLSTIRADLDLLPAAATWEDPGNLGKDSVQIVGSAAPVVGQSVCRSGRTEGWSCGDVDEVGIYVVGGSSGDPADLRSFRGFLSYSVQSGGGDSGGPWISGNYAVGTHSAGNPRSSVENYAVAATLQDSLQVLPGVELRLFLNKPVLTAPLPAGPVAEGQRISGRIPALPGTTLPAGSRVRITVPDGEPLEIPVGADGLWSFTAPAATSQFSAQAANGFSSSAVSTFRSQPQPAAPAPAPPGPAEPDPAADGPAAGGSASGDPAGSGAAGEGAPVGSNPVRGSKPVRPVAPAVLTPAPEPSVVAVQPQGQAHSWAAPAAGVALADTGASGLLLAAGGAAAALIVGALLLVVARRRRRR